MKPDSDLCRSKAHEGKVHWLVQALERIVSRILVDGKGKPYAGAIPDFDQSSTDKSPRSIFGVMAEETLPRMPERMARALGIVTLRMVQGPEVFDRGQR